MVAIDIPGHTVSLVVGHCKIVMEHYESKAAPKPHIVEVSRNFVMAVDKTGREALSLNADMVVPLATDHTGRENFHTGEAD